MSSEIPPPQDIDDEDVNNLLSLIPAGRVNPSRAAHHASHGTLPGADGSSNNTGLSSSIDQYEQYEPKGMVAAKIPPWPSYPSIDDEIDELYDDETLQVIWRASLAPHSKKKILLLR